MKNLLAIAALTLCLSMHAQKPLYLDETQNIEKRIEDVMSRMTFKEKIGIIHAQSKFSSPGVPRLGIPDVWTSDGPHGIRSEVLYDEWNTANWSCDSCTAFPALSCLAATWNPALSHDYGVAIGEEARFRNKAILLGPGVNIYRTPYNGRNFEYMGEDPYLASKMVVPYIHGVQSNGVAACVKHYALNNQESNRNTVNVDIDDRALYEIYLPAFRAAVVEGKAWSIMGAYNLYQHQHCCHNQRLLVDILRKEWNFDGAVVSDWGGVHDTKEAALFGIDMEFGSWTDGMALNKVNAYDEYYLASPYAKMLQNGEIPMSTLDDKVRNVLRLIFRTNMKSNRPLGSLVSDEHLQVARHIAQEGIVLLKNEGNLLPLEFSGKKILVVGENALRRLTRGGGSSQLKAKVEVSPLNGISARFGKDNTVTYARGYKAPPLGMQDNINIDEDVEENRSNEELRAEALRLAKDADVVLFFGGLNKAWGNDSEGGDRKSLSLPYGQDELISDLAAVNKNIAVILLSGNAVSMPWLNKVAAVVEGWYLGSENGNALADVLSGDVNPSGKLPFTFPASEKQIAAVAYDAYDLSKDDITYRESIFVGYRFIDKNKMKPLFAFGHGLSYTTFRYGKLTADKKEIAQGDSISFAIDVTNTGSRYGAETVQLYIGDPKSSLVRPVKELKGFQKVYLRPGETKTVRFTIGKDALSYFDDAKHQWIAEPGIFTAYAAAASDDVKSQCNFKLK